MNGKPLFVRAVQNGKEIYLSFSVMESVEFDVDDAGCRIYFCGEGRAFGRDVAEVIHRKLRDLVKTE
jgi:hypothetical protein